MVAYLRSVHPGRQILSMHFSEAKISPENYRRFCERMRAQETTQHEWMVVEENNKSNIHSIHYAQVVATAQEPRAQGRPPGQSRRRGRLRSTMRSDEGVDAGQVQLDQCALRRQRR